jgi:aminoglycoside 6'-N-acetyltransferase
VKGNSMEHKITFRDMNLEDLELMITWRNEEEVKKYYGNPSFNYSHEYVINKYKPRILKQEKKNPNIIEFNNESIGYLQFYILDDGAGSFDLFIGSSKHRDRGLGTIITKKLIAKIKESYEIDLIKIKVNSNNHRAIRCYEKCGFRMINQEDNKKLLIMEYKG